MTIRMLGPAGPIGAGRAATIRASLRTPMARSIRARWEWDDGQHDETDHAWSGVVHARLAHRYADPGVYRVRILTDGGDGAAAEGETRYVTVRRRDQLGASGWIRDAGGKAVPFGFLISPAVGDRRERAVLRCLIGADELVADHLAWLMAGEPGSLHFGGDARLGTRTGEHPYRVDVRASPGGTRGSGQHVTISVYAPDGIPGRDSPVRRISGPIRPGLVDLPSPPST